MPHPCAETQRPQSSITRAPSFPLSKGDPAGQDREDDDDPDDHMEAVRVLCQGNAAHVHAQPVHNDLLDRERDATRQVEISKELVSAVRWAVVDTLPYSGLCSRHCNQLRGP